MTTATLSRGISASSADFRFLWDTMSLHSTEQYYPLRPEMAESAFQLFTSTRDARYQLAGKHIYQSLQQYTKASRAPRCFAFVSRSPRRRGLPSRPLRFFRRPENNPYQSVLLSFVRWRGATQAYGA